MQTIKTAYAINFAKGLDLHIRGKEYTKNERNKIFASYGKSNPLNLYRSCIQFSWHKENKILPISQRIILRLSRYMRTQALQFSPVTYAKPEYWMLILLYSQHQVY